VCLKNSLTVEKAICKKRYAKVIYKKLPLVTGGSKNIKIIDYRLPMHRWKMQGAGLRWL